MQNHEKWLLIGGEELKLAKKALLGDDVVVIPTVYLTQQAAEKALKGYLVLKKILPPKTHDLVVILDLCMSWDPEFSTLIPAVKDLNPYSSQCRYPEDSFAMPSIQDVEKAISEAEQIIEFVKEKMDTV